VKFLVFAVSMLLLALPTMLVADMLFLHPDAYRDELRVQIVTAILSLLTVVAGYWIGSSNGSARKTDMMDAQHSREGSQG
jgi:heme/copper-type cytochrome/quinol oxidase subunit 4